MDIAELGLRIDSSGALVAVESLKRLTVQGTQTEAATNRLTAATDNLNRSQRAAAVAEADRVRHSQMALQAAGHGTVAERERVVALQAATVATTRLNAAEEARAMSSRARAQVLAAEASAATAAGTASTTAAVGVGRLATGIGSMAAGGVIMAGAIAGLAALRVAYDALTEKSREAREEQERQIQSLRDLAAAQREAALGEAGMRAEEVKAAQQRLESVERQIQLLGQIEVMAGAVPGGGTVAAGASVRVAQLRAEQEELTDLIRVGELERHRINTQASDQARRAEAANLAALVASNRATEAERQRALDLLRRYEEQFSYLSSFGSDNPQATALRAEALANVDRLTKAFERAAGQVGEVTAAVEEMGNAILVIPDPGRRAIDDGLPAASPSQHAERLAAAEEERRMGLIRLVQAQMEQHRAQRLIAESAQEIAAAQARVAAAEEKVLAIREQAIRSFFAGQVQQATQGTGTVGEAAGAGIAGAITGGPLVGLLAGLTSLSGSILRDIEERKRQFEQNAEVMRSLTISIEEWGRKVQGLSAGDIGRFAGSMQDWPDAWQRLQGSGAAIRAGALGDEDWAAQYNQDVQTRRDVDAAASFFGFDFGENIDSTEWEQLLQAWTAAMAEARDQVRAQLEEDSLIREARLTGDPTEIARVQAGIDHRKKLAEADELLAKTLIDIEQYTQLVDLANREYSATLDGLAAATLAAAEAARQALLAFQEDATVRAMMAAGLNEEAEAYRRRIEQQREMNRAVEEFGEGVRPALEGLHAIENTAAGFARVLAEMDRAIADAADAAREAAQAYAAAAAMNRQLTGRMFDLAGDGEGAFVFNQRNAVDDARAQGLPPAIIAYLEGIQRVELDRYRQEQAWRASQGQDTTAEDAGRTLQELLRVAQDQLRTAERDVQMSQRVLEALDDFNRSLVLSDLSPLSSFDQLTEAGRQFEDLARRALAGDPDAALGIPEAARAFLEASRAYNASGIGFVETFDRVQDVLAQVQALFADRLSEQEQMVAELRTQTEAMQTQTDAIRSHQQATEDFRYEVSAADMARLEELRKLAAIAEEQLAEAKRRADKKLEDLQERRDRVQQEQRDILRDMYDLWAAQFAAPVIDPGSGGFPLPGGDRLNPQPSTVDFQPLESVMRAGFIEVVDEVRGLREDTVRAADRTVLSTEGKKL